MEQTPRTPFQPAEQTGRAGRRTGRDAERRRRSGTRPCRTSGRSPVRPPRTGSCLTVVWLAATEGPSRAENLFDRRLTGGLFGAESVHAGRPARRRRQPAMAAKTSSMQSALKDRRDGGGPEKPGLRKRRLRLLRLQDERRLARLLSCGAGSGPRRRQDGAPSPIILHALLRDQTEACLKELP